MVKELGDGVTETQILQLNFERNRHWRKIIIYDGVSALL